MLQQFHTALHTGGLSPQRLPRRPRVPTRESRSERDSRHGACDMQQRSQGGAVRTGQAVGHRQHAAVPGLARLPARKTVKQQRP